MKIYIHSFFIVCIFCLCACNNGNASGIGQNKARQDTIKTFILPAIPPILTTPDLRADFLVKHYWDNVNFADTNYIHHPEVTEQAWADYCDLLNHVPLETAQRAMRQTIEQTYADKKVFNYITDLADKYLYAPNSPMRNEEFYIPVLDAMLASPVLEEIEKVRPQARRELAQKNRIGTQATDFHYTTVSGAEGTLYQHTSDYTLLFINNPGCHACTQTIEALKNTPVITKLLQLKKLTLLSIFPDEDFNEWKKHMNEYPKEWTNGYDPATAIKTQQLYDLQAIPTLYLLSKDKTVLLKDASVQNIEEYLLIKSEQ